MTNNWTEQDVLAHMATLEQSKPGKEVADDGPESRLQGKITKWAKDHGFPCLSFRQSRKARGFLRKGWPDITLVMKGRVLFIELKAKRGALKQEQKKTAMALLALGQEWYEIRSYKRFLEVVNK